MNQNERTELDQLKEKVEAFITADEEWKKSLSQQIETITRGIYGDEANEVDGLLTRTKKNESEIRQLENKIDELSKFKFKVSFITGVLLWCISLLMKYIIQWLMTLAT
jgi:hypothetical protein